MKTFIQRFGKGILGILHGFDRIRFRGTRRLLANVAGMFQYLWQRQILLKDFKAFASDVTAQIRQAAEEVAVSQGRPVEYLHNSGVTTVLPGSRIGSMPNGFSTSNCGQTGRPC